MRRRAANLTRNVDVALKAVSKAVAIGVIDATPVDTGRARSNWQASTGTANMVTVQPYSPGRRLGLSESSNANAAINQANRIIDLRKPYEPLFIQNNVHYIQTLNSGSSAQAGPMFVQIAILRGIRLLSGRVFLK
jgi:hypothetical protein